METTFENGAIRIKTLDEEPISFIVNAHRLKVYTTPLSKDEFVHKILQQSEMEMVDKEVFSTVAPT